MSAVGPMLVIGVVFAYYLARQPAGQRATASGVAGAVGSTVGLGFKIVAGLFLMIVAALGSIRIG